MRGGVVVTGIPVGQVVSDHAAAEADALQAFIVSLHHFALQLLSLGPGQHVRPCQNTHTLRANILQAADELQKARDFHGFQLITSRDGA